MSRARAGAVKASDCLLSREQPRAWPPSRSSRIPQRGGDSHTSVRLFKGVGCRTRVEKGPSAAKVCIRSSTGRGPVDTWTFGSENWPHARKFCRCCFCYSRLSGIIVQVRPGVSQDRDGDCQHYANDTPGAGSVPFRTRGETARVRPLHSESEQE